MGQKEWKDKTDKDSKEVQQPAKTRARGQAIARLRDIYPASDKSNQDDKRGPEFAEAVKALNEKYKILPEDKPGDKAYSTRTAIYKDAPEGKRSKSSQAEGANKLTGRSDYIGAHLVKREWGGADNMWNVVAWLEDAEKQWAANFEHPMDMKGILGKTRVPFQFRWTRKMS